MSDNNFKNEDEFEELLLEFPEEIIAQQQAYHVIFGAIDECIKRSKITPTSGNCSKLKQYDQLYKAILDYFGEIADNIEVDDPRIYFAFHGIRVKLETLDLITEKSEEIKRIFTLLKLSDEVIFTGDEEDYFHISFYINGIWQE